MSLIRVEHIQLKRCACIQSEVCVISMLIAGVQGKGGETFVE